MLKCYFPPILILGHIFQWSICDKTPANLGTPPIRQYLITAQVGV